MSSRKALVEKISIGPFPGILYSPAVKINMSMVFSNLILSINDSCPRCKAVANAPENVNVQW